MARFSTAIPVLLLILGAVPVLAEPQAGAVLGKVTDASGVPLQNATIILSGTRLERSRMTTTSDAGAFEFSDLPAGPYSAEVLSVVESGYRRQGYEPQRISITLSPGQSLRQDFRLRMIVSVEPAQIRPELYARPQEPRVAYVRLSEEALPSFEELVEHVQPLYPQSAKDANIEADVALEVRIGPDGRILWLRVLAPGVDAELARAAVEAVSQWRYRQRPVKDRYDSQLEPTEVQSTITVRFRQDQ